MSQNFGFILHLFHIGCQPFALGQYVSLFIYIYLTCISTLTPVLIEFNYTDLCTALVSRKKKRNKKYKFKLVCTFCTAIRNLHRRTCRLHGPSMLPDKAKFVVCSIISLALSFWMKHLVIGQLQKPAKFLAFHWSTS